MTAYSPLQAHTADSPCLPSSGEVPPQVAEGLNHNKRTALPGKRRAARIFLEKAYLAASVAGTRRISRQTEVSSTQSNGSWMMFLNARSGSVARREGP